MVVIVRSFGFPAVELQNLSRVPSTDELRPTHCPSCGVVAGLPGALNLVGHGLYRRQLLGLADAPRGVVVHIRRFLCLGCRRTASILPDEALPQRWYAGAAILVALVMHLVQGASAEAVRRALECSAGSRGWKALERWKRQFLESLWHWKAAELGCPNGARGAGRAAQAQLLRRFLNRHGATAPYPPDECLEAARAAVIGTAHTRARSWQIGRTA
jgi:hypothetical protein